MINKKNKILFTSSRERKYPRNNFFINALEKISSLDIISPNKEEISRGSYVGILFNSLRNLIVSTYKILRNNYSLIFIGFFGQFMVFPISLITKCPIYFDFFVSAYDTLVNDRKVIKKKSLIAKLLYLVDYISCKSADMIFFDTKTNLSFFMDLFELSPKKLKTIYVGCNEEIFFPRESIIDEDLVIYYSTYMPLHGTDIIIKAAKILNDTSSIHFNIIGYGMEYDNIQNLSRSLGVTNIKFISPITLNKLPDEIAKASICLGGHFGTTQKAKRVIPGKVFQILAMKKAVIVGDNHANRELLTHGYDSWFCEMDNPKALAKAIDYLHKNNDVRNCLAEQGYKTFKLEASNEALMQRLFTTMNKNIL